MKPEINVQEPFKKTWRDPQIISRDDIIKYEKSQAANKEQLNDTVNAAHDDTLQKTTSQYLNACSVSASSNEVAER